MVKHVAQNVAYEAVTEQQLQLSYLNPL